MRALATMVDNALMFDVRLDTIELPRCHAAVVMSHHLASDESYLRGLRTRIQGPLGIDIGAAKALAAMKNS
jgi:hypothetical protein